MPFAWAAGDGVHGGGEVGTTPRRADIGGTDRDIAHANRDALAVQRFSSGVLITVVALSLVSSALIVWLYVVLIAHETHALVRDAVCCRKRGRIEAKGIARPVAAYEVVDLHENLDDGRWPVREELPNARIELDLAAISEDERHAAAAALRRVLKRLAALDHAAPPPHPVLVGEEAARLGEEAPPPPPGRRRAAAG